MRHIAQRLLDKNPKLAEVLDSAEANGQYKAIEPFITKALCQKIGKEEGIFVQQRALIWEIIDAYNGEEDVGLVY